MRVFMETANVVLKCPELNKTPQYMILRTMFSSTKLHDILNIQYMTHHHIVVLVHPALYSTRHILQNWGLPWGLPHPWTPGERCRPSRPLGRFLGFVHLLLDVFDLFFFCAMGSSASFCLCNFMSNALKAMSGDPLEPEI